MAALWSVVNFPSRLVNWLRGGSIAETLCFASLHADAPLWLRVIAAAVEERVPGHLAHTVDR